MIEMDRIIKEKNVVRVCIVLRKGLDKITESSIRMRENINSEMKVKESELTQN